MEDRYGECCVSSTKKIPTIDACRVSHFSFSKADFSSTDVKVTSQPSYVESELLVLKKAAQMDGVENAKSSRTCGTGRKTLRMQDMRRMSSNGRCTFPARWFMKTKMRGN